MGLHVTEALETYTDINLRRVMENSLTRAGEPEPSSVVSEAVGRDGVGTRTRFAGVTLVLTLVQHSQNNTEQTITRKRL